MSPRIALHTPCAAQAFRPAITSAVLTLGKRLGLALSTPSGQTCCGLVAWEAGHREAARAAARIQVELFSAYDVVITTSPACLRLFTEHLPHLLSTGPEAEAARKVAAAATTWTAYLVEHVGLERVRCRFEGKLAYFPPCTEENETPIRRLLAATAGAEILPDPVRLCCGYGNNLSWRHPHISRAMATSVITSLRLSQADIILTSEVGCYLQLAPLLAEAGGPSLLHVAEFLATYQMTDSDSR